MGRAAGPEREAEAFSTGGRMSGSPSGQKPNLVGDDGGASVPPILGGNGAGGGNRTLVASLENWNSTIELHPL